MFPCCCCFAPPPSSRSSDQLAMPDVSRPSHHSSTLRGGVYYRNPWPSASAPSLTELLFGGAWLGWPKLNLHHHRHARELRVVKPDWGAAKVRELEEKEDELRQSMGARDGRRRPKYLRGTWLGHASVLVEIPLEPVEGVANEEGDREKGKGGQRTLKLLFDPIFSERAGPTSYTGPGRIRPPPCKIEDLPGVDAVLISHNHYDHLDYASIAAVRKKCPKARYFVPLGNKSWLTSAGVDESQIHELDWWDAVQLCPRDFALDLSALPKSLAQIADEATAKVADPWDRERIRFTCVPAQHNSGRSPTDQAATLWSGWVVEHLVYSGPSSDTPSPSSSTSSSTSILSPAVDGEFSSAGTPTTIATSSGPSPSPALSEATQTLMPAASMRLQTSRGSKVPDYARRVTRKGAIYHAGDTGYRRHRKSSEICPAFEELGRKYGPFDLSFIPIWRGGSFGFVSAIGLRLQHENITSALHGSPADAVNIHLDVKSRNSVGIHFGTFIGAESEALEAVIELNEAIEDAGVRYLDDPNEDEKGRMGITDVGETCRSALACAEDDR
ncbi:hypothetical protein JCM21900_006867 [Sporobolomyces salmonicolor]